MSGSQCWPVCSTASSMRASRSASDTGPDLMNCGRLPTTERTRTERGYNGRRRGPLAQLAEQGTLNPKVGGSIPPRPIRRSLAPLRFHARRFGRACAERRRACRRRHRLFKAHFLGHTATVSQTEAGLGDDLRRLVIERSHDLITMIDPDGTIVYASPSWAAVLGYDPDEVVGTPLMEYTHPDDLPRGLDAIATQAGGTEVPSVITRRRTKDGRWLHIESSSTPVFDAAGNVTAIIGSARDVTESEELRQRVRELNALYRVADEVARTTDLDALFGEALDALIEATGADRASLLVYDDAGVMRFRAWRGLSDAYRAAAEGHSPWTRDAVSPEPLLVADVTVAGFEPELESAVVDEGIAALAFVPIVHAG